MGKRGKEWIASGLGKLGVKETLHYITSLVLS